MSWPCGWRPNTSARDSAARSATSEAGLWCGWALAYGLELREPKAAGHEGWRVAAGMTTRAGKRDTLELVQRRLPNLDTTPGRLRTPHMGLVDAAGIALGCRAHHRRA